MSPEIREAALRAAAKVAIVFSLGGCGAASPEPSTPAVANGNTSEPTPTPTPTPAPCDAYLDQLARADPSELAPNDPLRGRPDLYGRVFANAEERDAPRTQACCRAELEATHGGGPHRWECCSAIADAVTSSSACTPWGPPFPPEMTG